jgi:hypothetical protein
VRHFVQIELPVVQPVAVPMADIARLPSEFAFEKDPVHQNGFVGCIDGYSDRIA